MKPGIKIFNGLIVLALLLAVFLQTPVFAKSAATPSDIDGRQSYIVVLEDLPLSAYDGRSIQTPERRSDSIQLEATANHFTGAKKLDVKSPRSRQYLNFLNERFESFQGEATLKLGRQLNLNHRYRIVTNGFATKLSTAEAEDLRNMPMVKSVRLDEVQRLETDSGPDWIGAGQIHDGSVGFSRSGGEGTVIGVIDTGVNWDHPSFDDPGEGGGSGWDHVNPYNSQLGLCSKANVLCNDKLVGVYDFIEEDPGTEEEENSDGKDESGHGSHVASTAAGNPLVLTTYGEVNGVAPNANIVSYRVCYPEDGESSCLESATLKAIDQATEDRVDVINYSIGSPTPFDPWYPGKTPEAFLNAWGSGIFVVTSAGNEGPQSGTIGSPANAPWIMAAGDATHDRVSANVLENMTGGDTTPPPGLAGASRTSGIGVSQIVHAKDFGNALCGTGIPADVVPNCDNGSSSSNPFPPGTFNGEIVVCDRGDYGRVEKGKNVMLAGAGGYVLANTPDWKEYIGADSHCLPATHLGVTDGDRLRTWLETGTGHQGSISDSFLSNVPGAGDVISYSSSRGPNMSPVENILKPDLIAPGTDIVAAWDGIDTDFAIVSGTSMASPHIAGGAALIKSVHPAWTPPMLASTIVMTSTPELAIDYDGSKETPHKRGAGRPQLDLAVNAGVYLDETKTGFLAANPNLPNGEPKNLNLPGLVDTVCRGACDFQRTVTDLVGGASWSASTQGFAEDVSVSITPANFSLANGGDQALTISVDLTQSSTVGKWVYGEVRLTSSGYSDAVFPLAVFSDGGQLPDEWQINTDSVSGWQEFALSDLATMPDATYTSGGLVVPTETVEVLPQDPFDNPYNGGPGKMTVWHTVPAGTLWLHTQTLASVISDLDLDLYVGLDANKDGRAQESEEICSSTSPTEIELCDLFTPVAGDYWVIVQNWVDPVDYDETRQSEAILKSAVVGKNTTSLLAATGPGIIPAGDALNVRLSWDNVSAVPGTELMGAVGIGTDRDNPNNIGIIPVSFTKTGVEAPKTLVLMNGISRGLTLDGNGVHNLAFIDVPPGTDTLTVTANGADETQNNNLVIELYRVDFNDAFTDIPFATAPDTSGNPLASASGANGNGPEVNVTGVSLDPGRWYAVLKNNHAEHAAVEIQADLSFTGDPIPLQAGMWQSAVAGTLVKQGIDYIQSGPNRAFLWYTYNEDGSPAWYQVGGPEQEGNVWVAGLNRLTNDGAVQQAAKVGRISITLIAEQELIFSFVLFGEEGSGKQRPTSPPICPEDNGSKMSYNGIWSRKPGGIGGATVLVNSNAQGYVQYIYDGRGNPVWLQTASAIEGLPNGEEMTLSQWSGYCAVCAEVELTRDLVGLFTNEFHDEENMTWTLDYVLEPPLSGSVNRTNETRKLTTPVVCQ